MIVSKNKVLLIQRLTIFAFSYLILSFFAALIFTIEGFNKFYNYVFLVLLVIDIVFIIICLVKDYGVFKLFIVIQNILFKLMYLIVSIVVILTTYYTDNILSQAFVILVLIGMITYPIFIIIFLINSFRGEKIVVDKSALLLIINGISVYLISFLVKTEYAFKDSKKYLSLFEFRYGVSLLYIPFVIAVIIYVVAQFKKK